LLTEIIMGSIAKVGAQVAQTAMGVGANDAGRAADKAAQEKQAADSRQDTLDAARLQAAQSRTEMLGKLMTNGPEKAAGLIK
jgi:hypothetical protein